MTLTLPYPPSTNRLWRVSGNRLHPSPAATAFKAAARHAARLAGACKMQGALSVHVRLHPRTTQSGAASKTRLDIDNAIKCALDAGNGVLWDDDKQVIRLFAEVAEPRPGGGLSLAVSVEA